MGVRLAAKCYTDKDEFSNAREPGSFYCSDPDSDREQFFWYCCPCGCGIIGVILVGRDFKPETAPGEPSWILSGTKEEPTLFPSVNYRGNSRNENKGAWHGWLNNGVWESV